jgi:hypothetical protein
MNSSFYPKDLYVGCDVIVATAPEMPKNQWRLGRVMVLKNDSCDIQVATRDGLEYRHDVMHINDPRCKTTKTWADPGVGVFDISPSEKERKEMIELCNQVRAEIADLRVRVSALQKMKA